MNQVQNSPFYVATQTRADAPPLRLPYYEAEQSLSDALGSQGMLLSQLEQRLQPVLQVQKVPDSVATGANANSPDSLCTTHLKNSAYAVEDGNNVLRDLLARLDI